MVAADRAAWSDEMWRTSMSGYAARTNASITRPTPSVELSRGSASRSRGWPAPLTSTSTFFGGGSFWCTAFRLSPRIHSGSSTAISGTATETTRGGVSDGTGVHPPSWRLWPLRWKRRQSEAGDAVASGVSSSCTLATSLVRSKPSLYGTLYWLRHSSSFGGAPAARILSIASMIASLVARNSLNIGRARYVRCSPSLSVTTRSLCEMLCTKSSMLRGSSVAFTECRRCTEGRACGSAYAYA